MPSRMGASRAKARRAIAKGASSDRPALRGHAQRPEDRHHARGDRAALPGVALQHFEGDQHAVEFGRINPNHKLPAIVDHDPAFGGGPHDVFESGAILQYLAGKTGQFLPQDPRKRSDCIQWLTWQVASMGPMSGQAAHFVRYAPERIPYAIERYAREMTRLLTVLERRLAVSEYVGCDAYSIANMATLPGAAPRRQWTSTPPNIRTPSAGSMPSRRVRR